jgi:hypothetical protein
MTSTYGKMHNQIDHVLTDIRLHAKITFKGAGCDAEYYLVVSKVSMRLSESK